MGRELDRCGIDAGSKIVCVGADGGARSRPRTSYIRRTYEEMQALSTELDFVNDL